LLKKAWICNEPTLLSIQALLQMRVWDDNSDVRAEGGLRLSWLQGMMGRSFVLWSPLPKIVDVAIVFVPEGKLVDNPAKRPAARTDTMEGRVGYVGGTIRPPTRFKVRRVDIGNHEGENLGEELSRESKDRWQGLGLVRRGHGLGGKSVNEGGIRREMSAEKDATTLRLGRLQIRAVHPNTKIEGYGLKVHSTYKPLPSLFLWPPYWDISGPKYRRSEIDGTHEPHSTRLICKCAATSQKITENMLRRKIPPILWRP
jgi:hypothetical protein